MKGCNYFFSTLSFNDSEITQKCDSALHLLHCESEQMSPSSAYTNTVCNSTQSCREILSNLDSGNCMSGLLVKPQTRHVICPQECYPTLSCGALARLIMI